MNPTCIPHVSCISPIPYVSHIVLHAKAMLVKALYYIENQDTHVWIFEEEREDQHSFYVLNRRTTSTGPRKLR